MFKVQIKNIASQQYTHGGQFPSMEEAQSWIDSIISQGINCPWGKLERLVPQSECSQEELDSALELIEAIGEEGDIDHIPAMAKLPQEFEIETIDITAQVEQEQINKEALEFLIEADWKRNRHLSQLALGIETSLSEVEYLSMEAMCQTMRDSIVR